MKTDNSYYKYANFCFSVVILGHGKYDKFWRFTDKMLTYTVVPLYPWGIHLRLQVDT